MTSEQQKTITTLFDGIGAFDTDAVRSAFADDATITVPENVYHGKDGAERLVNDLSKQFVAWVPKPLRSISENGTAVVEWTCTITDFGGSQARLDGCSVVDFDDNKVHRLHSYWRPEDARG